MKKIYICEKCDSKFQDEATAVECESSHRAIDIEVKSVRFCKGRYDKQIPKKFILKFSDSHGDFGTYILECYGFKGM